ncbi:MAG: family 20 glycosylhydrolase, partial [bacterium]
MKTFDLLLTVLMIQLMPISILTGEGKKMEIDLMPVPASTVFTDGKFRLSEAFTIMVKGDAGDRLYRGATRTLRRLAGRTGIFFPQDYITPNTKNSSANLIIECSRTGKVILHEDESYSLVVTPEEIKLSANTDIGALRGLETFLQLLKVDEDGYYLPAIIIKDRPRFPWRGLLIDACRHFMPVEVIKRNLDGM